MYGRTISSKQKKDCLFLLLEPYEGASPASQDKRGGCSGVG